MSPTPANLTPAERGRAVRSLGCFLIILGLVGPPILLFLAYFISLVLGSWS